MRATYAGGIVLLAEVYTLQNGVALNGTIQQSIDSRTATAGPPVSIMLTPPQYHAAANAATAAVTDDYGQDLGTTAGNMYCGMYVP